MQISFDTGLTTPDELTAIIALCASLGGRLPAVREARVDIKADMSQFKEALAEVVSGPPAQPEGNEIASGAAHTDGSPATNDTGNANTPSESTSIELDADGIPWDERIHASTKTKTKQDVWTKKRNVDEVLYGQVHAELQEQYARTDLSGNDVPPPPTQEPNASNTTGENAPTDDTDVPPPPAPAASAGSNEGAFDTFADLVTAVGKFNLPMTKLLEIGKMATGQELSKFFEVKDHPDAWGDVFDLAQAAAA